MPYILPPNNALAALFDPRNVEAQRSVYEADLRLQLADRNNTPGGAGAVRGWGGGRTRGYGSRRR